MEGLKKGLEIIIEELERPPKTKSEGEKFYSRFASVPVNLILDIVGFNNYREHTIKRTDELSKSIEEQSLLEPIILTFDTKEDGWDFIDGEGRFWACYQLGADEIPVEIFYDIPEATRIRMKISANATKEKIDSEDLSLFAKNLANLLITYYKEQEIDFDRVIRKTKYGQPQIDIREFSKLIGRHQSTVRKYFTFANLEQSVIKYTLNHREDKLFSRAVKIGIKIKEKEEQRKFFKRLIEYEQKHGKLSKEQFNYDLRKTAELLEKKGKEFTLESTTSEAEIGKGTVSELFEKVRNGRNYIDAFTIFIQQYPQIKVELNNGYQFEISNCQIEEYLILLKQQFERVLTKLDKKTIEEVNNFLSAPPEKSFREKIFEQAQKRRKKIRDKHHKKINAIGDEIEYIPIEQISGTKKQPRTYFKKESIDRLATEIKEIGQLKPGLVRQVGEKDNQPIYKVIYGNSRLKAARKSGKKYYKAFIRNDLTDVEIAILQCMEDLSERDTPEERAKVLNKHYELMKLEVGLSEKEYTKKDFIKNFGHLGDERTLTRALDFMELDTVFRDFVNLGRISYTSAIEIGTLKKEEIEEAKIFEIIYETMADKIPKDEVTKIVQKARNDKNQLKLNLDVKTSYNAIFREFEYNSRAPFDYLFYNLGSNGKTKEEILSNTNLFIQYARLYKSIKKLEAELKK